MMERLKADSAAIEGHEVKFDDIPYPEWLKKVRIKDVCSVNPATPIPVGMEDLCFFPMESISVDGAMIWQEKKSSAAAAGYSTCKEGDVVFAKVTPCFENGKSSVVPFLETKVALATTEVTVLRPGEKVSAKFIFYRLKGHDFSQMGKDEMKGSGGLKRVPEKHVASFAFALPALHEQKSIADFLDRETALIDQRLALIERKKELLSELKKSVVHEAVTKGLKKKVATENKGLSWAGEVPAHWEVKRVENCSDFLAGHPFDSEFFGVEGVPLVRIRDLTEGPCETFYSGKTVESAWVGSGDILLGMDGDFKVYVWNKGPALLNQRVAKIVPKRVERGYLTYALQLAVDDIHEQTTATTVKHLSMAGIARAAIPFPPADEQVEIGRHLDEVTGQMNQVLKFLENKELLLKEQRKALIHEVVTGKRRVI